ncbi:xanthine dehydrogenase family protein molybdopterin-binding subunit [Reyranella sp. CPCC 100927]|uniref:xanthine dehydrogenase family protein molybdopterin-binding subunit n=1 Tax=Reyranella sp. CPCC 100927 TaxID=2599616 RepID=UPI0011B463DC|nr:xanthine dehydrogenase family protein molybdopterin-binding subunit [Reyranella sp. CPCC 100927]TWT12924.1 xanthine dehydrogenase family protein molybdopterin-binding subunit [Reyranella sp. CPCC 100927]
MSGIGQAVSRLDGPGKVSGRTLYIGDIPLDDVTYAVMVPATRPHARIRTIDLAAATAAPGVIGIFTHHNTPRFGRIDVPLSQPVMPLQDDRVLYEGQPVALVVADTLERATHAARLVAVAYDETPFDADFAADLSRTEVAPAFFGIPPDNAKGDVSAAWSAAEVQLEGVYRTADRHHSAMEPAATLAIWRDGELRIHDATQGVFDARACVAQALHLDPEQVRVSNTFIGGGFGGKGWGWPYQILAAMAARELGRPVKLVLTRAQTFTSHGYQAATHQTVALSAQRDGTLSSIRHDSIVAGSFAGDHVEGAGWDTHALYASPAFSTTHRLRRLHRGNPAAMRAPFGGVGLVAVEIAMDELAYKLGMDPLALRLKNHTDVDPSDGKPFSAKKLRACYEIGARRFGWSDRRAAPRSMRDGRELVGYGMSSLVLRAYRFAANARVSIDRDGAVRIETATQDVGQGLSTVIPQIAADALGVPVDRVSLVLGDTILPVAPFTGGSSATMSVGSAVQDAAVKLRERLIAAGANGPEGYAGALAALNVESLSADGTWAPADPEASPAIFSFGAVFAEVGVDEDIPIPRVRRIVGVYDAGKIMNPKTARSQMTGGVVWGIGQALLERSETDPRLGRFVSKNLAGYLVPVNADIPEINTTFVESFDPHASPLGARGIGELGALGVAPAIANAVFHATGVRVREVPIRPEHLLVG